MKKVCLFDIDGTLLNSGGAGQHAMEQALLELFQVTGPYENIPAAGRTDRAITTDLFAHHQLVLDEAEQTRFLNSYLSYLPTSLREIEGVVLPGIPELLKELSLQPSAALGLLTGNFEAGAFEKLRHYQIDHYFQFGGYGDVHHDRADVARTAYEAAKAHLAMKIDPAEVWVIGDTPADISCARAIGAKVIAVATGIFSKDELAANKPDKLYDSFAEFSEVVDVLLS